MDDQRAEQIMETARQLDSETATRCGAAVHVSFRGFDQLRSEVGHASVEVTSAGVRLSELEHTPCSSGIAWSRSLARSLVRLNEAGRQRPHMEPTLGAWLN